MERRAHQEKDAKISRYLNFKYVLCADQVSSVGGVVWVNTPSKVHAFFQTEDEYTSWHEKDILNGSLDSYTLEG